MYRDRRLFPFESGLARNILASFGATALSYGLYSTTTFAHGPHAHVHGVASLQVAVDGRTLSLDFDTPLDNLIGFEHAPRTESQKAAVRNMVERLRKPEVLFVPTAEARCAPVSAKLDSSVLDEPKHDAKAGGDKQDEHADLSAEYVFTCERPELLRDLELKHFESFRNLRQVDVQVISARGQRGAKLSPSQRRVSW